MGDSILIDILSCMALEWNLPYHRSVGILDVLEDRSSSSGRMVNLKLSNTGRSGGHDQSAYTVT